MPISATQAAANQAYVTTLHPMRRAGDIVVEKAEGAVESVALTRTEPPLRVAPVSSRVARPDASFIAHLIATAEQVPQTRELRRAAVADVEAAYRAAATNGVGSMSGRTQRLV